jgi:hypothetical protein
MYFSPITLAAAMSRRVLLRLLFVPDKGGLISMSELFY